MLANKQKNDGRGGRAGAIVEKRKLTQWFLRITDWYTNPEKPDERFKATVYNLDTRLRADGQTVTNTKQTKGPDGNWTDSNTSAQTQVDFENAILTKARQLRLSNIR